MGDTTMYGKIGYHSKLERKHGTLVSIFNAGIA